MQCAAKNQFGSGMCIKGLNQRRTEKGRVKSKILDTFKCNNEKFANNFNRPFSFN
jgi:hypothetical protein